MIDTTLFFWETSKPIRTCILPDRVHAVYEINAIGCRLYDFIATTFMMFKKLQDCSHCLT